MSYKTEEIIEALKSARKAQQINQRELGARSGIAQSHISKIENGAVDITLSTLVDLARSLDQEVVIVPRQSAPAVLAIIKGSHSARQSRAASGIARKELNNISKTISRWKVQNNSNKERAKLLINATNTINGLYEFSDYIPSKHLRSIRQENNKLKNIPGDFEEATKTLKNTIRKFNAIKNELAPSRKQEIDIPRSVYSLEDDHD